MPGQPTYIEISYRQARDGSIQTYTRVLDLRRLDKTSINIIIYPFDGQLPVIPFTPGFRWASQIARSFQRE